MALRDGRTAVIRRAREEDAEGLLALDRALIGAGVGVVRAMEELPADAEAKRRDMRRYARGGRSGAMGVQLVALIDGEIVGEGDAHRYAPARVRHCASVSLGVAPSAQGLGVGRALFAALLDWCRATRTAEDAGVNRVRLDVFATNERAIALYRSFGFRICGARRRMIRNPDGTETDDYEMELLLDEVDSPALPDHNAEGHTGPSREHGAR